MISKDSIEEAYCFFHQKWQVYVYSSNLTQKDDIEYAIGSYVDSMNPDLYQQIAGGKGDFLQNHTSFKDDLTISIDRLNGLFDTL